MNYNQWFSRVNSLAFACFRTLATPSHMIFATIKRSKRSSNHPRLPLKQHSSLLLSLVSSSKKFSLKHPRFGRIKARKWWIRTRRVDTGSWRRIKDTIGSWRFTISISCISTWGGWTRSSRQWQLLSELDKPNNVVATTKRWKRSTTPLLKSSLAYATSTTKATTNN